MTREKLLKTNVAEMSIESYENIVNNFEHFDKGLKVKSHELEVHDKVFVVTVDAIRNEEGYAWAEIITFADITIQKRLERDLKIINEKVTYLANHDNLTKLLNFRSFYQIISERFQKIKDYQGIYSMLFFDIDYFKQVNDKYGHHVGDIVLEKVASIISSFTTKENVYACRFGGEEFLMFLEDVNNKEAFKIAEKIREAIANELFEIDEYTFKVTISIGVSQGDSKTDLLIVRKQADNAMYIAKKSGRNQTKIF